MDSRPKFDPPERLLLDCLGLGRARSRSGSRRQLAGGDRRDQLAAAAAEERS